MTGASRIRVDVQLDAGRVRLDLTEPTPAQLAEVNALLERWLDAASPEPAPEPEIVTPEPAVVTPEPAVVTPEPEVVAAEPEVTTPDPEPVDRSKRWSCTMPGCADQSFTSPQALGSHRRYKHGAGLRRASSTELAEPRLDSDPGGRGVEGTGGRVDLDHGHAAEVDVAPVRAALETDTAVFATTELHTVEDLGDGAGVLEVEDESGTRDLQVDAHAESVAPPTDNAPISAPSGVCRCGHGLRLHERDTATDSGRGMCFRSGCGCAEYRNAS